MLKLLEHVRRHEARGNTSGSTTATTDSIVEGTCSGTGWIGGHWHEPSAQRCRIVGRVQDLWQQFLQTNPHVLPPGKKGKRVASLQAKVQALRKAKQSVEAELQRQLDFFDHSQEEMEAKYQRDKVQLEKQLHETVATLEPKLDAIGTATRNLEANGE